ncbi:MAG: CpsD/CapB family tyrosine-protein kinase [Oscillospiraceae bacterium]|jgi:capsular exopolysaccharide synthesis family protein|nr:CpsD/CapB family tyrosine-protein kinase [Oscillospiraceae bacterium]
MSKEGIYLPNQIDTKEKNLLNPQTPFIIAEAYKTARANLIFSLATSAKKVIVVTSANSGEGKSTTVSNLGLTFAGMGASTLIIDADLRKPSVHKLFGLDNKAGLSTLFGGFCEYEYAVRENIEENLDIITSGPIPPNPAELLVSDFMRDILNKLSEHYDYILIDTPPVNVVTDSQLMNGIVSGIVFVVWEGGTTHTDINKALRSIEMANGRVLGFIKANCNAKGAKNYRKDNYYKYSDGKKS